MTNRPFLHDFSWSRAVVMGTWDYRHLESVTAVRHSYDRMVSLLTDPLCGWPSNRLLQLENETGPGNLADRLIAQFEAVDDVALFYYVGHGQMDPDGQLCLGLVDSRTEPNRRAATSLPFQALRKAVIESPAVTKIVILDCCFAGLANQPANTLAARMPDAPAVAGAYTVAASDAYNTAWYETDPSLSRPQTYFTKYLADLVEAGLPGYPPVLCLQVLFNQLSENLARAKLPTPSVRNVDAAQEFPFAHNAASLQYRADPDHTYRQVIPDLMRSNREPHRPASRWRGRRLPPLSVGYALSASPASSPVTGRFLPTPVDETAARRVIEHLAKESTAHPGDGKDRSLDELVDALAAEWVADVREQHAYYLASVSPVVQAAEAEVRHTRALLARDRGILSHKVMALASATALYLAHTCGILFRDCMAGAAAISKLMLCACLAIWLSLGMVAFFIRLGVLSSISSFSLAGTGAQLRSTLTISPAILFLALYLGTGLAAGIGAYIWRNPLLDSYVRATRAYLQAHRQADMSFSRADSAEARLNILRTELTAAEQTLEREIRSRLALAEMLQQVTRR